MRKLIVSTYVTLDGVIQPLDWPMGYPDEAAAKERGTYAHDLLFEADTLLMGRETYEGWAQFWPSRNPADDGPGGDGVTDRMNSLPKYVASTTLKAPLEWNATLLGDDVPGEIAKLKAQSGKSIVMYGCGRLAKTLLEHNLADEFRFWVYPVVRGKGTRLFNDGVSTNLDLVDTRTFGGGFTVLTCVPKKGQ